MRFALYTLIIIALAWQGCTVQKRRYQKGFYFANQSRQYKKEAPAPTAKSQTRKHTAPAFPEPPPDPILAEASASTLSAHPTLFRTARKIVPDDTCDLIFLKNGEKIRARIMEIGIGEVRYNLCDMPGGPVFINRRSELVMILYSNGTQESFNESEPETPAGTGSPGKPVVKKQHPQATVALILSILGLLLLLPTNIVAIVLASNALKDIKKKPKEFEGEGMAKVAIVISIIKIILVVMIIAASFSDFWW